MTIFLKEISGAALITQKLWPVICLWKAVSVLCVREDVCSASISLHSCVNRSELRACTLMWVIILITFWKMVWSSSYIVQLSKISIWVTEYVDSQSQVTSLTRVVKPKSCPVMEAAPSVLILTQNYQYSFCDMWSCKNLNSSAAVVLVGNKRAQHKSENISHKNKHCCLVVDISRLVNLDYVPWWLINPL